LIKAHDKDTPLFPLHGKKISGLVPRPMLVMTTTANGTTIFDYHKSTAMQLSADEGLATV
jgi:hypothetical protein